jgi:predicted metallopeptidase
METMLSSPFDSVLVMDPQKNVTIIREKLRQISQQQRVKVPINVSQKKIRRNC